MDHAGFDTYNSLYRARDIFQVQSAIIISQRFHLPRALFIAEQLGLPAVGLARIAANTGFSLSYSECREIPARMKAFLMAGVINRRPAPRSVIPISGDGR